MSSEKDISLRKAQQFIYALREAGIDVSEAYIFGSFAQGSSDKDSDIDLAVVSDKFQGVRYHDMKMLSKYRRKVDLRLEIHPFSKLDVEQDPPQFFLKIKQSGIQLQP